MTPTHTWAAVGSGLVGTSGSRQPGRVLMLNGGSSAGKTTLGRTLQATLPDPWLLLGIDLFTWMLPPNLVPDDRGLSVRDGQIVRGDLFLSLYAGFRTAVAALARSGVDVVLDDLTLDGTADQQRWNEALGVLDVMWVGVRCAPAIAAERESRRQTRLPGIARQQAGTVHRGVRYDVEVDTGVLEPHQAVAVITESMGRRWPMPAPLPPDRPSTFPPIAAWSPGEPVDPAPWER